VIACYKMLVYQNLISNVYAEFAILLLINYFYLYIEIF